MLATDPHLCPSLNCACKFRFDLLALRFCVHGTKPRVLVHSVADLQALDFPHKLLDKLIVNALDDIQSFHGKAGLSTVVEPSDRSTGECFVDVRVFADNHRVTASKLQRHALHATAGYFHDVLAGLTLTGKCDADHLGIAENFFANDATGTRHHIEHSLWQAGLVQQFDDTNDGKRRG